MTEDANDQLLTLNHEIRRTESDLGVARRRRRLSNVSFVFGPVALILMYAAWWVPVFSHRIVIVIYIPTALAAVSFAIATVNLKTHPGGPAVLERRQSGPVLVRKTEDELELQLARQRDSRKVLAARTDTDIKVRRIAYKDEAYEDIDKFRAGSGRYRRVNNVLQVVLIVGSIGAATISALTAEVSAMHWLAVGVTFTVGICSGFLGYFKPKERSFYLQQTADSIESEWEAVEVGVGRYKRIRGDTDEETESERLAEFVEEVHRLKLDQMKRQQNLDQPESRNPQDG